MSKLTAINQEASEKQLRDTEATQLMQADRRLNMEAIKRLCHKLFVMNPDGKELIKRLQDEWMTYPQANPRSPNYKEEVIFEDGYLSCLRSLSHNSLFYKYLCEVQACQTTE